MSKHTAINDQELYNRLKESIERIKSPGTRCGISGDSQEQVIRIPMNRGYEAAPLRMTPEAYAVLEPIYKQEIAKTGKVPSTDKLADGLLKSVLRIKKIENQGI